MEHQNALPKILEELPSDIHKLLDGHDLESSIDRFKDDIGSLMLKRFSERDRPGSLRMSNIGRPLRQLWYELHDTPGEKLSGQTKFKFLYGDLIETLVLFLAEAAGHKVERLQEEIQVDGIQGHIDAVIDGVLVDVKSCSSFSFDKFKYGKVFTDDPFGYVGQLSGYAQAINLPAAWIPIDKVNGDIIVTRLPQEQINAFNVSRRISEVRQAVERVDEPERCYSPRPISKTDKSGNLVLGVGCSYCGWKEYCWRDSNGGTGLKKYIYSTGPKWFTTVMKEPRLNNEYQSNFTNNFDTKQKEEDNSQ